MEFWLDSGLEQNCINCWRATLACFLVRLKIENFICYSFRVLRIHVCMYCVKNSIVGELYFTRVFVSIAFRSQDECYTQILWKFRRLNGVNKRPYSECDRKYCLDFLKVISMREVFWEPGNEFNWSLSHKQTNLSVHQILEQFLDFTHRRSHREAI